VEEHLEVQLNHGHVMLVDQEDLPTVEAHYWSAHQNPGKRCYADSKDGKFHNLITGWKLVDHINRDGLDNRRCNLRQATPALNARNRKLSKNNASGVGGVLHVKEANKHPFWCARWMENGKRKHRSFSIKKYGEETAKRLATEARRLACQRLDITND
jgi:hypothetical protein